MGAVDLNSDSENNEDDEVSDLDDARTGDAREGQPTKIPGLEAFIETSGFEKLVSSEDGRPMIVPSDSGGHPGATSGESPRPHDCLDTPTVDETKSNRKNRPL